MNPYDKSLDLTETTTIVKTNQRGMERILHLVDDAFEKGLAERFDSFDEMIDAAENVGFETQGLRDYLRDQEILVQTDGPSVYVIALVKPGATIGGQRVQDYSLATIRDQDGGLVFIVLLVPTKKQYAEAERRGRQFQAVAGGGSGIVMTEADMEEIRQHMLACPDNVQCAIFMTQMAINAGIEMMAIAAGRIDG